MNLRFRHELRKLIKDHGIDTYLDAPDWFVETTVTNFLETIREFHVPTKFAQLNNMAGTILQPTTAQASPNAVMESNDDA